MIELDDDTRHETRSRSLAARVVAGFFLAVLTGAMIMIVVLAIARTPEPRPTIGALTESVYPLPPDISAPALSDATSDWGLTGNTSGGSGDPVGGGAALADIDNDGDLDLVVANGKTLLFEWNDGGFDPPVDLGVADAVAVAVADIDRDGRFDIAIGRRASSDVIVWGGQPEDDPATLQRTELDGGNPTGGLLVADLTGDGRPDILRLGRGGSAGTDDVIWVARPDTRGFDPMRLPGSGRLSLAAEIADVDLDGLVDIWVTRDVGWDTGGDSLYSRQGDATGPFVDISQTLATGLEVDGMGVTLADLDGDRDLDAYISDIGDNELLTRNGATFELTARSGAARIRPPGAPSSLVSSSWASGAADINLDGILDLVVVNGGFPDGGVRNKIPGTEVAVADMPAILIGIGDGRYVDTWPDLELDMPLVARGMTIGDVEGDGDDDVIVIALDGSVTALRNDSNADSVTVTAEAGCDEAGTVVEISSADRTVVTLLSPHAYAGAHSRAVTVGVDPTDAVVELRVPGRTPIEQQIAIPASRGFMKIPCE
jgi:FG-GAP-like repeat